MGVVLLSFSLCPRSRIQLLLIPSFSTWTQSAINSQTLYRVREDACGVGFLFVVAVIVREWRDAIVWLFLVQFLVVGAVGRFTAFSE